MTPIRGNLVDFQFRCSRAVCHLKTPHVTGSSNAVNISTSRAAHGQVTCSITLIEVAQGKLEGVPSKNLLHLQHLKPSHLNPRVIHLNSPDACDALCAILLLSSAIDGPDASVGIKLVVHCFLFQVSCSHLESLIDFRNELQLLFCQNELDAPHFRAFVFRRSFQHPGEAEISTSTARCFLVPECQVTMNLTFSHLFTCLRPH